MLCELRGREKVVGLVTENGHHLRQCLHPQCFEKNIFPSDDFYKYYDLRKQYHLFTERVSPVKNLITIAQGKTSYQGGGKFYRKITISLV